MQRLETALMTGLGLVLLIVFLFHCPSNSRQFRAVCILCSWACLSWASGISLFDMDELNCPRLLSVSPRQPPVVTLQIRTHAGASASCLTWVPATLTHRAAAPAGSVFTAGSVSGMHSAVSCSLVVNLLHWTHGQKSASGLGSLREAAHGAPASCQVVSVLHASCACQQQHPT